MAKLLEALKEMAKPFRVSKLIRRNT